MPGLPTGVVTFLFTDIEGSTRLAHELGDGWVDVLQQHNRVLRDVWRSYGGAEVSTAGDSFFVAFSSAAAGVAAATAAQRAMTAHDWAPYPDVRVRAGLHTGEAHVFGNDYVGLQVHVAARVSSAAHGGQLLLTDATRERADPLPGDVALRDLGTHRLKDVPWELRLWQVAGAGIGRDFPPLNTVDVHRNNVPAPPTAMIGREREAASVDTLLDSHRLVTVLGTGGVGKTRLATAVATQRIGRHRDGTWFVELDSATNADDVARAMADVLRTDPTTAALTAHVAARDMLIVLDNCEQVLDAVAPMVDAFVRAGPRVFVLATSREPIGIRGEHLVSLAPLAGDAALALFNERLAAHRQSGELRDDERTVAMSICERLDGLPLALELAAARGRVLALDQIDARLEDRFRLLSSGPRTASARQQTLLGAVEWSYERLTDGERDAFMTFGVFAGEFDIDAAAALLRVDVLDALDVVAALLDRSLIQMTASERYRLLYTLRAFALDRLRDSGRLDVARSAHARWVHDTAVGARGSAVLAAVRDDVDAALRWSRDADVDLFLGIIQAMQPYWLRTGRTRESRAWLDDALSRTFRPWLASGAAMAALAEGDSAAAHGYLARARAEAVTDQDVLAIQANSQFLAIREGDLSAVASFESDLLPQVLALGEESTVIVFMQLADAVMRAGDPETSMRYARSGLHAVGPSTEHHAGRLHGLLGEAARAAGDRATAHTELHTALAAAQASDDETSVLYLDYVLAELYLDEGDVAAAASHITSAVDFAADNELDADLCESAESAARLAFMTGDTPLAAELIGWVDATRTRVGYDRSPFERMPHAALVRDVTDALGDAAFADACARGIEWDLATAAAHVLEAVARVPAAG